MEKLFSPNRLFVSFCALLVIVFLCLQYVSNIVLAETAKVDGEKILNWQWPTVNLRGKATNIDTKILSKTSTEAVVEVDGKQSAEKLIAGGAAQEVVKPTDCKLVLTYYHTDKHWILGRVEQK
jgi:hypothetical protein